MSKQGRIDNIVVVLSPTVKELDNVIRIIRRRGADIFKISKDLKNHRDEHPEDIDIVKKKFDELYEEAEAARSFMNKVSSAYKTLKELDQD